MNDLRNIFLFICIAFTTVVLAQNKEERVLAWSAERRLTWADYQGKFLKTQWAAATTASGITYSLSSSKNRLDIYVSALFYPDKSWYKKELCSDVTLSHEQLHFDITEMYARKFKEALKDVKNDKDIKKNVRAIFAKINKEHNIFQRKYDRETDSSRDVEVQMQWNDKIGKALGL